MNLSKDLSILLTFSKDQLLVSLMFSIAFFLSISFTSTLTSDFFPSAKFFCFVYLLSFICSSFSDWFSCNVRLFI